MTTAPKTIDELVGGDPSEIVALTCINLPEALIVIDCGANTEKTREFRQSMEQHFTQKVSHLFLTHSHWDHADALNAFQDVTIVISKKGAAKLKADHKVVETFTLGSKGNEVHFHVVGGHSLNTAIRIIHREKKEVDAILGEQWY